MNTRLPNSWRWVALLITSVLPPAQAEEADKPRYTLPEGRGWSVCEGYLDVLNSEPVESPYPICKQHLNSRFKDLREPEWEEMDIQENLDIVYAIEENLGRSIRNHPNADIPEFEQWKAEFAARLKEDIRPRLRRVQLALVPDGPVETVLAYEPDLFPCDKQLAAGKPPYPGGGTYLYLVDSQNRTLDKQSAGQFSSPPRELLLYQGKPLLFSTYVGSHNVDIAGHIFIEHFKRYAPPYKSDMYFVEQRCRIRFDRPESLSH